MNETILNPRQNYILSIISQSEGLQRAEIQERVKNLYPISKPTLIRDLNILLSFGLIKTNGKARVMRYLSASASPLLRYFDLDQYFTIDPDKRTGVKKSFEFSIFSYLQDIFLRDELQDLQKSSFSYKDKTTHLAEDILRRERRRWKVPQLSFAP